MSTVEEDATVEDAEWTDGDLDEVAPEPDDYEPDDYEPDDYLDDYEPDDEPRRDRQPVGTALAVVGGRALDVTTEASARLLLDIPTHILVGALAMCVDLKWHVLDLADRDRLIRRDAAAAAGVVGAKPSAEADWKRWREVRDSRVRRTVQGAALVTLVTLVVCVQRFEAMPALGWGLGTATLMLVCAMLSSDRDISRWLVKLSPWPVPVALPFGVVEWRWWPPLVIVAGLLVAAGLRGWWEPGPRDEVPETVHATGGFRAGMSFPSMWATVSTDLAESSQVTATSPGGRSMVAQDEEVGVIFPAVVDKAITREALASLERVGGLPVGAAQWIPDRERNGSGELWLRWTDVLDRAARPPGPAPRGSKSVHEPFRLARGSLGRPLMLSTLRKSLIVLGATGSGKTSLGWVLLDHADECGDVECWGIDLRRKNLIAPWAALFGGRVAYTVTDAAAMLDRAQAEIDRRVSRIADALEDADEDDIPDENWIPTDEDGRRQIELFVDELTSLTPHKELREKLALIEETGRQAAVVVRLLTPDLSSSKIKDSSIHDQPHIKIVMATSQYDIKEMFGAGASAQGWSIPATWERPRDAGKLLIASDEHLTPTVYRADRYEIADIKARRKWRRVRAEQDGPPAPPQARPEPDDDDGVIDAEVVGEVLDDDEVADDEGRDAALRAALDACGDRPGLPAAEASDVLTEAQRAWVRRVAPSRPTHIPGVQGSPRAHRRSALVTALTEGPDGV